MKRTIAIALILLMITFLPGYAGTNADTAGLDEIDLDLSNASATVVFAQVSNMYAEPWNYLDAVIRIRGTLDFYVKSSGQECSMVMVQDATACCGQGLEFVRKNDGIYSNSCPDYGQEVVVTGRFEIYQEDGASFIHLVDAELEWDHL